MNCAPVQSCTSSRWMCSRGSPGSAKRQPAWRSWSNAIWNRLASTCLQRGGHAGRARVLAPVAEGIRERHRAAAVVRRDQRLVVVEVGADPLLVAGEGLPRLHADELRDRRQPLHVVDRAVQAVGVVLELPAAARRIAAEASPVDVEEARRRRFLADREHRGAHTGCAQDRVGLQHRLGAAVVERDQDGLRRQQRRIAGADVAGRILDAHRVEAGVLECAHLLREVPARHDVAPARVLLAGRPDALVDDHRDAVDRHLRERAPRVGGCRGVELRRRRRHQRVPAAEVHQVPVGRLREVQVDRNRRQRQHQQAQDGLDSPTPARAEIRGKAVKGWARAGRLAARRR